jgi:hypothetical protein
MLFRFENRVLTGIYERREGEVTEGWNKWVMWTLIICRLFSTKN